MTNVVDTVIALLVLALSVAYLGISIFYILKGLKSEKLPKTSLMWNIASLVMCITLSIAVMYSLLCC